VAGSRVWTVQRQKRAIAPRYLARLAYASPTALKTKGKGKVARLMSEIHKKEGLLGATVGGLYCGM